MGSDFTATITPCPSASECEADGCSANELLAKIEPEYRDQSPILCPQHRVEFLREVSNT